MRGRPTVAEIDLGALRHNVGRFKERIGPGVTLLAVVKADAYGHGAIPVANAALQAGAGWLGVATAEEGVELRQAGIASPILILGVTHPDQADRVAEFGLSAVVVDEAGVAALRAAARRCGTTIPVHLKVDTGMGRIGWLPRRELDPWLEALVSGDLAPELQWEGLCTHFAEADEPDPGYTEEQLRRFLDVIERLRRRGAEPLWVHAANSAASWRFPGTHFNMVRVGLGLYGLPPVPEAAPELLPVMTLKTAVVFEKSVGSGFSVGYGRTFAAGHPLRIVTLPIGYADGVRRGLSNCQSVLIQGRRFPLVGRVSMDQITIALPADCHIRPHEPVVLIGAQGEERITVDEWATVLNTISYEIVTGIGKRVPREYLGE